MQKLLSRFDDKQVVNGGILFTILVGIGILALGTFLTGFELIVDDGSVDRLYEWQLLNPTVGGQISAWLGFALHMLLIWGTIYWATERSDRKYGNTLKPVNWIAIGINILFIGLHFVQTAVFYDGIAQDMASWTSQYSVIMMLFIILVYENRRRGMFFGKKLKLRQEFYRWIRTYHPYAFSFAVIYTFWFHPMVATLGHIIGFAYVILIMLQGSLMFTRAHLNKRWIVLLELLVLPHAVFLAVTQSDAALWMFFYGFMTMFIVTQMHALNLKTWVKNAIYVGFALSILIVYSGLVRQPADIREAIRVQIVIYGMALITYAGWWLVARSAGLVKGLLNAPTEEAAPPVAFVDDDEIATV